MFGDRLSEVRKTMEFDYQSKLTHRSSQNHQSPEHCEGQAALEEIRLSSSKRKMLQNFKKSLFYFEEDAADRKSNFSEEIPQSQTKNKDEHATNNQNYNPKDGKDVKNIKLPFSAIQEDDAEQIQSKITGKKIISESMQPSVNTQISAATGGFFPAEFQILQNCEGNVRRILQEIGVGTDAFATVTPVKEQLARLVSQKIEDIQQKGRWQEISKYIQMKNRSILKKKISMKKVRVVSPQTDSYFSSLKENLTHQLHQSLNLLIAGLPFVKYCFNSLKSKPVHLSFSYDFKFMAWISLPASQPTVVSLIGMIGISSATKSKRFQQYLKEGWKIEDGCAVSIMFKERSYDFEAKSEDQRDRFVAAIKLIRGAL